VTAPEAVERLGVTLAHLWMVRTFLKHADEVTGDAELVEVPRLLFDTVRAVEPARERGDHDEFLRRLKGKLPKLRRAAELLAARWREVSSHTNFEMASVSLTGAVRQMEDVFVALAAGSCPPPIPPGDLDSPG
jgi:hypothetical protein